MAAAAAAADYALEREVELARLESENEELRIMAGLLPMRVKKHINGSGEVYHQRYEVPLAVRLPSMNMQKAPSEKLNLL